jgi:peptidoglycan/LPS O-acetylase OafA/YrhL
MFGHAFNYYDTPNWLHSAALVFNGRAAVVIFFVLSGYVLTRSLRKSDFSLASVLRFYVQRLFRIYPAIWAASSLGLLYLLVLHWRIPVADVSPYVRHEFRADRMDALHIIASFAGMLAFIIPQLWSIFVEIVASAVLPVIAFLTFHRRSWLAGLLAAALLVSYTVGPYTYYLVGLYFVDFVAGAVMAMPGSPAPALFRNVPAPILVGFGLLALSLTQFIPLGYYDPSANVIEIALATMVIATLVYAERRVRILSARWMVLVGDISYSIYLLHYVVLCVLATLFTVLQAQTGIHPNIVVMSVVLACTTAIFTCPLAWLSFTYVEKPGVLLGKKLLGAWPGLQAVGVPGGVRSSSLRPRASVRELP